MRLSIGLLFLAVSKVCFGGSVPQAAIMDFEGIPAGTLYGAESGHSPGDKVLTQNGVDMRVQNFRLGGFIGFYRAEIGGEFDDYFPSTPLEMNNISVEFDFHNVGFEVLQVTLDFQEFGGSGNFAVNGMAVYELASLNDIPWSVAPGVYASVGMGTVTLLGPIDSFRVGGQELAIDNVMAVPEPMTYVLAATGVLVVLGRRFSRRIP